MDTQHTSSEAKLKPWVVIDTQEIHLFKTKGQDCYRITIRLEFKDKTFLYFTSILGRFYRLNPIKFSLEQYIPLSAWGLIWL